MSKPPTRSLKKGDLVRSTITGLQYVVTHVGTHRAGLEFTVTERLKDIRSSG